MPGSIEWQYRSQFQGYSSIPRGCFYLELGIRCLVLVRLEAKGWMSGKNGN